MGWLISYDLSKQDQIKERVADWSNINAAGVKVECKVEKFAVRGNVLWKQCAFYLDGKLEDRFVAVDLLRKDRGYGWGYKNMDESVGPCETNCPKGFILATSEANGAKPKGEFARNWREKVLARYAPVKTKEVPL